MNNKKVVILIILSIGAVASLIYGISSGPSGKRRMASEKEVISHARPIKRAGAAAMTERLAKKTEFDAWGRNPFTKKEIITAESPSFSLNGIVWDEKEPRAIINAEIVGIGDKIGNITVIDIKQNKVILNDGTDDFELVLEE